MEKGRKREKRFRLFVALHNFVSRFFCFTMRANRSFVWGEAPLRILRKGALFFCFGRGLMHCSRAGLRRTTIFSVQKEQKNAILLLLFNILCRKTFVLAFLSKTLDYSQMLCYNSIRDFVS